jgi:hypothetical protein
LQTSCPLCKLVTWLGLCHRFNRRQSDLEDEVKGREIVDALNHDAKLVRDVVVGVLLNTRHVIRVMLHKHDFIAICGEILVARRRNA